jgi:hypothetical protein
MVSHDRYNIDEKYSKNYHVSVPAPFTFAVAFKPRGDRYPTEDGSFLIGFNFLASSNDDIVEKVSMYKNTVPMGSDAFRFQKLDEALRNNTGLKKLLQTDDCETPTYERVTRVNFTGIMVTALCNNKKQLFKLYSILNPKGENGVSIKAHYDLLRSEVHESGDVFEKGAIAYILSEFKFLP